MEIPQEIKKELPYDLAVTLLNIYPKEMKSLSQSSIYTPIFALLFTVVKLYKHCSLTERWIKKMPCVHTHTQEYYSAMKNATYGMGGNSHICDSMDETGENFASEISYRKTNTVCYYLYVEPKKREKVRLTETE